MKSIKKVINKIKKILKPNKINNQTKKQLKKLKF